MANGNSTVASLFSVARDFLKEFGVSTVFLCVLTYFAWSACQWLGVNMLVPITRGHVELLDAVKHQTSHQTEILEQIQHTNDGILQQTKRNGELLQLLYGEEK